MSAALLLADPIVICGHRPDFGGLHECALKPEHDGNCRCHCGWHWSREEFVRPISIAESEAKRNAVTVDDGAARTALLNRAGASGAGVSLVENGSESEPPPPAPSSAPEAPSAFPFPLDQYAEPMEPPASRRIEMAVADDDDNEGHDFYPF